MAHTWKKIIEQEGKIEGKVSAFAATLTSATGWGLYERIVDAFADIATQKEVEKKIIAALNGYKVEGLRIEEWLGRPGVYRWHIKANGVTYIYVGRSNSLARRIAQHLLEIFYQNTLQSKVDNVFDLDSALAKMAYKEQSSGDKRAKTETQDKYQIAAALINQQDIKKLLDRVKFEVLAYIVPSTGVELPTTSNYRSVYGYIYDTPIYYNPQYTGGTFYRNIIMELEETNSPKGNAPLNGNLFRSIRADNRQYANRDFREATMGAKMRQLRKEYGRKNFSKSGIATGGFEEVITVELENMFLDKISPTTTTRYFNEQGKVRPSQSSYKRFLTEETWRQLGINIPEIKSKLGKDRGIATLGQMYNKNSFSFTALTDYSYSNIDAEKAKEFGLKAIKKGSRSAVHDAFAAALGDEILKAHNLGLEAGEKMATPIDLFYQPYLILCAIKAFTNQKNVFERFEAAQRTGKTFKIKGILNKSGPATFFGAKKISVEIKFKKGKGKNATKTKTRK